MLVHSLASQAAAPVSICLADRTAKRSLSYSPVDPTLLACASDDFKLHIWTLSRGGSDKVQHLQLPREHSGKVTGADMLGQLWCKADEQLV